MKFASPRQLLLLTVLLAAMAGVVVWQSSASRGGDPSAAAKTPGGAQGAQEGNAVGDLRLESLDTRGASPIHHSRNAFQFRVRQAAPTPVAARPTGAVAPPPPAPVGPPPPPPIPLRYIGYLDQVGDSKRLAVLSDGRGNVFNGKEGDIIEGRYRVVRIGTDSADLTYVDGRGRQTIRLSGQ